VAVVEERPGLQAKPQGSPGTKGDRHVRRILRPERFDVAAAPPARAAYVEPAGSAAGSDVPSASPDSAGSGGAAGSVKKKVAPAPG